MIGTNKIPVEKNVVKDVSYTGISYNQNNILLKLPSQENIDEMINRIKWKKDDFVREKKSCSYVFAYGYGIKRA